MKFPGFPSLALFLLLASCAFAGEQKLLDIALKKGGGGDIRVFSTDAPNPVLQKIVIQGKGLGQDIDQTYTEADLDEMKKSGKPRGLVRIHGLEALTFLAGQDFTVERGGSLQVGYLASPSQRKTATVRMGYDGVTGRWWMTYLPPRRESTVRVKALELDVRTAPVVGPVGIRSVTAIDEFDRRYPIDAR